MKFADLEFSDDGTPVSRQFSDVYFSKGHGIDETHFVFIEQNYLPERFQQLTGHFSIGETGFGTGLNFLVTWRTFLETASADARLTFISCEKFPISQADLAQAHQHWPELADLSAKLREQYPPALTGYHVLEFDRVTLILMLDDAVEGFSQLTARIDAWFLDGFAPSKNPDMWQPELFAQINRLSHPETTFATFTAARLVRDGLSGAGFKFEKVAGFGRKRHMLRGRFMGIHGPVPRQNWPNAQLANPKPVHGQKVAIIGAGIAGVSSALELTKRGFQVELFEKQAEPASGGSGNRQGAVYAKLSAQKTASNQFYAQALILAQRVLKQLPHDVPHESCGLVQLVHNERELKRLHDLTDEGFIPSELARKLSAEELTDRLGVEVSEPGLWFDEGGWLSPKDLINSWLTSRRFVCHNGVEITDLKQDQNGWQLVSRKGEQWHFDQVILTTAHQTTQFAQTQHLPITPLAGQVTQLAENDQHKQLKGVICTDRYVMPTLNGQLTIGSTFRVKSTNIEVTDSDHCENISNLAHRVPALVNEQDAAINGRAAIRCNAPDYLPLVGGISEPEHFAETFRIALQRNRTDHLEAAEHWRGLWVNVAHGSKGLCSSHLCAKLLASMMAGEPLPLQANLVQALNPNRFLVRNLIREQRQKN